MKNILKIIFCYILHFSLSADSHIVKEIIIKKEKGAYLRIGDGDVALASGSASGTHAASSQLQKEALKV